MFSPRVVSAMTGGVLTLTLTLLLLCRQCTALEFQNPIFDGNSADPAVLKLGDYYYLTLSMERETEIWIFKSPILTSFRQAETAVAFRAPEGFRDIWASEMHQIDGQVYIYFCMSSMDGSGIHSYVIQARDPTNPMNGWGEHIRMLTNYPFGSTDGSIMKHDGKLYYSWGSEASLWIAPMINATTVGASKMILRTPTADWECSLDAVSGMRICIVEGPYFLYTDNATFLVFSAGSTFGPDYVLGLMSIPAKKDPMVLSNWDFGENKPVFWRNDEEQVYTTGHATFTLSPDGTETWMVYHASDSSTNPNGNRVARIDKITFDSDGRPQFPRPSGYERWQTVPSGQTQV